MNIISQILKELEKNIKNNINNYNLSDILTANVSFTFNNYIKMVNCIDDISYDFSTFLYSTFVEQIDDLSLILIIVNSSAMLLIFMKEI